MQIPTEANQILFVLGDGVNATTGYAFLLQKEKENWKVLVSDRVENGKKGWTKQKKEGDHKSPIGIYYPMFWFGKQENKTNHLYPYLISHPNLIAVDDPKSEFYNRILDLNSVFGKDWDSFEHLVREDYLYDLVLVPDINYLKPIPNQGSCLYHHVKRGQNLGTEGCIGYSFQALSLIMSKLNPKLAPKIIQGPREDIMPLLSKLQIQF